VKPIFKKLKYIEMVWNPQEGYLRLYGDNKFVKGEIFIRHQAYLYSILVVILRIFRMRRK